MVPDISIESIVKATLALKKIDDDQKFVPDYELLSLAKTNNLSIETCRKIRDVIQANRGK